MPWKRVNGKPQWIPNEPAERVSVQSDERNPSVTKVISEKVAEKYSDKKDTRRATTAGPPPSKYVDILGMVLVGGTTILAWWVINDVPHTEEDIQRLAMSDEEATIITTPLSRVIANSWIGSKFGHKIIGSEDYVALVMTSFMYCRRFWPAVAAKFDRMSTRFRSNQHKNEPSRNGRAASPQYQGTPRTYQEQQPVYINPSVSDT